LDGVALTCFNTFFVPGVEFIRCFDLRERLEEARPEPQADTENALETCSMGRL